MRRIDELHLKYPYYGARRIARQLAREGMEAGRLHVATLLRRMGMEARYRKPRTSIPAREGTVYPYLLEGVSIERPNQVWATDITYLPMAYGFLYLVAILDIASRKVLAWRISNTLTTDFCLAALNEALARYGTPEIFNSDQGAQFTSGDWLERLCAWSSTRRWICTRTATVAKPGESSRRTSIPTIAAVCIKLSTTAHPMRCTSVPARPICRWQPEGSR